VRANLELLERNVNRSRAGARWLPQHREPGCWCPVWKHCI